MRKDVYNTLIRYLEKEYFLRAVFTSNEWRDRTGSSILSELRSLNYPIKTETFYEIRREIMKDYGHYPYFMLVISNE